MTELDTILKRAFAEADEPIDNGFSVRVGAAVARRERAGEMRAAVHAIGLGVAGVTVLCALFPLLWSFAQDFLVSFGLEVARAQGALNTEVPLVANQAQGWLQATSAGLTQVLLIMAALAGGAVAYRASRD
ncbi:MAG: hypothetical protein ABL864_13160 [Terricaulis sp.]